MSQQKTPRYTLETLLPLNETYDREHRLNQEDVETVNSLVEQIENTRSVHTPQIGDRVIYVSRHGDYSDHALIETRNESDFSICVHPYVPFTGCTADGVWCDVSGGPFTVMKFGDAQYVGQTNGAFKVWGHCGPCGNGAVMFEARVGLWEYREANPLYGEFTTETWRKMYFRKVAEPQDGYLYRGDGIGFRREEDFQRFLNDFEATVFSGHWPIHFVVWCYRDVEKAVSRKEWDAIEAPVSSRRIYNRSLAVKLYKDREKHEPVCYYVRPEFTYPKNR